MTMLILHRKVEESIVINDNIEIRILEIIDGKVKIGIEAPKYISIHRKEIFLEIEKENREASEISLDIFDEFKENR